MHSHFSLSWDSYKTSICNGFSTLQQNEEFVDMTIAAEGHFVKVHQIIVALASPYLKELITSAQCQHPVIFLNNVSHKVLCLLLEYMYTGEAIVSADCLSSFAETAKALHIRGLESIESGAVPRSVEQPDKLESDLFSINVPTNKTSSKDELETTEKNVDFVDCNSSIKKVACDQTYQMNTSHEHIVNSGDDFPESMNDSNLHNSDDEIEVNTQTNSEKYLNPHNIKSSGLQFTVSIRGSLQVILNRYIYYLYSSKRSGLRRWRCVDYKNIKCSAYITTKGNVVLNRTNFHNHSFHDKKILSKIQKNAVYSAIEEVESFKKDQ